MAYTGQTRTYISSAKYASVTAWSTGAAKTVGQMVRQSATPSTNNERVFMCVVAGTTHASTEPTWSLNRGNKTTDNTVTWMEVTGLPAVNGDITNTPSWTTGAKNVSSDLGHIIKDGAGTHLFINTTAGNGSNGAEPTWNTSAVGNTTTDSTPVWTYIGLTSTFASATWAAPHARLRNANNNDWGGGLTSNMNNYFIGNNHAETQASAISFNTRGTPAAPVYWLCVNEAGSMPPVSADLTTGGSLTTTAGNSITLAGSLGMVYGLTFNNGTSGNQSFSFGGDTQDKFFESCTFNLPSGTGASSQIQLENGSGLNFFKGCTFGFTNAGHSLSLTGYGEFVGCTFSGTTPTYFLVNVSTHGRMTFNGCDLSSFSGTTLVHSQTTQGAQIQFIDCKMPASYTPGTFISENSRSDCVFVSRCDSGGAEYQFSFMDNTGRLDADVIVARTGGAKDSTTPISWKCVSSANTALGVSELRPPRIGLWNTVIGANVTATINGVINAAAVPTNLETWIDVDYLGASGNTQATRKSARVADLLATPGNTTADSTSDWTAGTVAARQNTHTYSVGDAIKVASNTGRIFFCTASSGNTAGSEPGGYASAVDGGAVTDGSATFRAGCRFSMAVTLTSPQPQIAGNLYAQIKYTKASTTCYFDPFIVLT